MIMIWKILTFILAYIIQAKIFIKIGELKEKDKNNEIKRKR